MLGAIKDGDPEGEDVPLFRLLARRWKPVVPVLRERVTWLSRPKGEPKRTPAWISKAPARAIYVNQPFERKVSKRGWNPWLWVK
jgi:hypothetical protein